MSCTNLKPRAKKHSKEKNATLKITGNFKINRPTSTIVPVANVEIQSFAPSEAGETSEKILDDDGILNEIMTTRTDGTPTSKILESKLTTDATNIITEIVSTIAPSMIYESSSKLSLQNESTPFQSEFTSSVTSSASSFPLSVTTEVPLSSNQIFSHEASTAVVIIKCNN